MEIYELYNFTSAFLQMFLETYKTINPKFIGGFSSYGAWLLTSLGVALGIWVALYLLQSFGLYFMAKKQNLPKRYLAFIPFANTWYMSKLAGRCSFFGRPMKNAGIYAMIAQILTTVVCGLVVASELYLYICCEKNLHVLTETIGNVEIVTGVAWAGLTGFSQIVYNFYAYSSYVVSIFELAYEVLMLVVVLALFRKYAPKHYFILSLLALFVPLSRYIIIFVLKNKQPIDYDAWIRSRRGTYFHPQQQNPYANPYGTSYGNPQGGYGPQNGNAQGSQGGQSAPADPFEEFASNTSKGGAQDTASQQNSQTSSAGGSDEFFS